MTQPLGRDLQDALRHWVGPGLGLGLARTGDPATGLWPAEEPATPPMVPQRRAEFAAGRRAVRAAMADLGLPAAAVPMADSRAPIWPDGMTGSIAHGGGLALAVVAQAGTCRSVGLDLEPRAPLSDDLDPIIRRPGETGDLLALFVAKEAAYKAHYPLTGRVLAFDEVHITWDGPGFEARILPPEAHATVTGRTLDVGGFFVSLVVVA